MGRSPWGVRGSVFTSKWCRFHVELYLVVYRLYLVCILLYQEYVFNSSYF